MPNILITSISKKVPLINSVRTAINKFDQDIKLYGGDIDVNCIGKYFVDIFWEMPILNDKNTNEIFTYLENNNINSIIPTRDDELLFWAKNKNRLLDKGIHPMISDYDSLKITLDKLVFYNVCKNLGHPVIQTEISCNKIKSNSFVVKEQFGAGSNNIGINLDQSKAIKHSTRLDNPIFQPFIKGEEISVDLYITKDVIVKDVVTSILMVSDLSRQKQ